MHDRRYATAAAAQSPFSDPPRRRGGAFCARSAAVGAAVLLASCQPAGVLDPQGPVGAAERLLLINSTAIMLVVVVPVILATFAFAWWYRVGNLRARRSDDRAYESRLEFVVWSIPALVVILLSGVIWIGSHELDPRAPIATTGPDPKALPVEVVSLDWKWLFIYPKEGIAAVNELVVPVDRPVAFRLTAATVMNSFFVPQLGSQIYTMPGMVSHLNLMASAAGDFPGFSANFSGDGFAGMRFVTRAVRATDFAAWVEKTKKEGPMLDLTGYATLAKPSENVPPATYRAVEPQLFQHIIDDTVGGPERVGSGAWCPPLRTGG
jgi:cytochrome o ubiquinol oxidase subunit II